MKPVASRTRELQESIFSRITQAAQAAGAINLSQGFPDFDDTPWIFPLVTEAMNEGCNQYAPAAGVMALREAVASARRQHFQQQFDPGDEITIVNGATEAIYAGVQALVSPGDEVIVFEPFYDSYVASILLAGGRPVPVTLHAPDFRFDPAELKAAVTPRTRLIICNNPNNPTGRVFSTDELQPIVDLALEHDLDVLSDEVYEYLTFDSLSHRPLGMFPGMADRTLTVSSLSKTFGLTGWKIGWTCAPPRITNAIRLVHQYNTFCVAHPLQVAGAAAMHRLDEHLPRLREMYTAKRNRLVDGLNQAGFNTDRPQGTYFCMSRLPDRFRQENLNDLTTVDRLIVGPGVAAIPPSVFYLSSQEGQQYLRFCFAKQDHVLAEAIVRLKKTMH